MAVRLVETMEDMAEEFMSDFVENDVVPMAQINAPYISGNLSRHIHSVKLGRFEYKVTTNSTGRNGFPYPAHIEAGEPVVARHGYPLHFMIHGRHIRVWETKVHATSTGFMKKTVDRYK